jgi:hypothetical protein
MSLLSVLLCAGLLAAAPTPPVRLAAPGLSAVNLDDKSAAFYLDYFAQQLSAGGGVQVITQSEVTGLIGLERQRELLGCRDSNASCLAELAGALGVDGLVVGSLARTSGGYAVNLKVVAANNARQLASFSERVRDDEALLDSLTRAARRMGPAVRLALGREALSGAPPPPPGLAPAGGGARAHAWLPAVGGGVALLAGGGLFALAQGEAARLRSDDASITDAGALAQAVSRGKTLQTAGLAVGGLGLAALAVGAGMYAFGGGGGELAVAPLRGGGLVVAVGGRFP